MYLTHFYFLNIALYIMLEVVSTDTFLVVPMIVNNCARVCTFGKRIEFRKRKFQGHNGRLEKHVSSINSSEDEPQCHIQIAIKTFFNIINIVIHLRIIIKMGNLFTIHYLHQNVEYLFSSPTSKVLHYNFIEC